MKEILLVAREAGKPRVPANRYKIVYCYKDVADTLTPNFKGNIEIIPDDFFTAIDFLKANNHAYTFVDTIYNQIIGKDTFLRPLKDIGGTIYSELLVKKELFRVMTIIFRQFAFAEKVLKHYCIKDKIDFIPGNFSIYAYNIIRRNGLLKDVIQIPQRVRLKIKAWETIRTGYYMIRLLSFPEYLIVRTKGGREKNAEKKYFNVGVHMHNGRSFVEREGSWDFIIDNKIIRANEVLFVFDEPPVARDLIRMVKKKGYDFINFFSELIANFSRVRYVKKYYRQACALRNQLLSFCVKKPLFFSVGYQGLRDYMLWELFYCKFYVKKFISLQHPGSLTRVVRNRKYGAENIFIHSSIVYNRLKNGRKTPNNGVETYDYTYLLFDKSCSDKLSDEWLRTTEKNYHNIKEYSNIGSLFSDIVFEVKKNHKDEIKKQLNIPGNKTIISFFDGTVGHNGTINYKEEELLLESALHLLETNGSYFVMFKFKNRSGIAQFAEDSSLAKGFERLFSHPRCICVNNLSITSFEMMGISDLVICTPISSVIFESVIGGIKTVCYDPAGRYRGDHFIINTFPYFTAHSHYELLKNVNYWLNDCGEYEFNKFMEDYIKKYADDYCDGRAIERFKKMLVSA